MKITLQDTPKVKEFVLDAFDKSTDIEGYIIEKVSKKRILSEEGQEVQINAFGAIKKGSEKYIANDIASLVNFFQKYCQK